MLGIFVDSFPPAIDGVGVGQYYTALELHKAGVDLSVVTANAEGEPFQEPFDVKRLPTILLRNRKPYGYAFSTLPSPVLSEVKGMDFDIVHCHSPFSVGLLGRKIARKNKVPFIATFHSKYWDDIYQATKSEGITELVVEKIVKFYTSADEVWIADPSIEKTLIEYGYYGPVEIVPMGIETAEVDWRSARVSCRHKLGLADDMPLFLFVGQHIVHKNIDLILDSLALLDDLPFRMLFVGTGNAKEQFEEKTIALGLGEKVKFAGLVSDRVQLMSYYAAADLFLFPSLYDTFGNVIREAAAMHTPSLLLRESTCATFVEEGVNGFTSESTPQAYADKIRELVNNRQHLDEVADHVSQQLGSSWGEVVRDEIIPRYEVLREKKLIGHNGK